jgi:Bacterial Ig-like domain (group 3)/FG-GAP-like repeat/HYDIN/CFA65/VesB-like, Ig-like domain/Abnormal spindle-like microcephaly-assoc'd, ASPM-SPD-2-Hydin
MRVHLKLLTLLSAIFAFLSLSAWTPARAAEFGSAVNYAAGTNPHYVAIGDFNGDHIPDLAVANFGSNDVSVLIGNGDGTFQAPVSYAAGPEPGVVAVGDFNGDGKLDIAAGNTNNFMPGGSVSILLGNGDGTFQAAVNYSSSSPYDMAVGDLNGDGKLDIVVANHGAQVSVLLGNGDGTFQAAVNYAAGSNPQGVAIGDFNGDGKKDLAVSNKVTNNLSILLGNGDGTFQTAVNYNVGTNPAGVVAGDFNADGKLDIAVTNSGSNNMSILIGNGDGTFQAAVNYATGGTPTSVAASDFNLDSRTDLVVTNQANSTVGVFLGNGDGTFQTATNYAAGTQSRIVAVADLNGDQLTDLAVADISGGVSVLLNIGGTTMSTASSANPSSVGQAVTFTTTVTPLNSSAGTPTGKVTFDDGSTLLGSVNLSNGQAAFTTSSLSAGTHTINALYSGDNVFVPNSAPPLTQTVNGTLTVTLSPTSVNFGTGLLGTAGVAKTVTMTNTSASGTVSITSISVTAEFIETNNCGSSLAAGASCTITLKFEPTAIGTQTGTLSVADDAAGSPQTVALSGVGSEVRLGPRTLNFGNQKVGTTSAVKTVIMTNVGTTPMNIRAIQIIGTNAGDFAQTNNCGTSLGASKSCVISVTFTPTATGARSANVSISDNGGASPQRVILSGTGT